MPSCPLVHTTLQPFAEVEVVNRLANMYRPSMFLGLCGS